MLTPALAHAQTVVEEITVTAQKRETKLETTPMTINVVSGDQIEKQAIREVKDLKASVPGLTLNESPGGLSGVTLRGIGTSAGSQLFEQSVGLFVDGVYHPRARQFRDGLFDVQRVEVIKGSQGVLFGKNTSIGAFSVVSRTPGSSFGGYVQTEYETEYQGWTVQGGVDLPVSDKIQVRLSGIYDDQEGWVSNLTKGRTEPAETRKLARAIVRFTPTDELQIDLKLQHGDYKSLGNPFELVSTTNAAAAIAAGFLDGAAVDYTKWESSLPSGDTDEHQTSDDHALTITYDLASGHSITAITGYSKLKFTYGFDSDSTPAAYLLSNFNETYEQVTQEVRLASPTGGAFDYIVGGFYMTSEERYDYKSYYRGFPVAGGLWGLVSQKVAQDEDAYALFGQAAWHVSPRFDINLGGRWSKDKKDALYTKALLSNLGTPSALMALVPGSSARDSVDDKTFDFSLTANYKLTDRSSLYASVGRGNKGGAFLNQAATAAPAPTPFKVPKESAVTYEVGVKGRFLDGRVYASLAAYHLDVTDYQDSYYDSAARAFKVRSLDAKSSGAEFEGQFQAADWLNLFGNLSWNPKAELANGERMQRAPKMTGTVGARLRKEVGQNWELSGNLELVHSDTFLHQPASAPGDNYSKAYNLVNVLAQATYTPLDLDLYVNVTNLTEEVYRTFSFGSPLGLGQIAALNQPRMVRLGLRKSF